MRHPLIARAKKLANMAHEGQVRPNSGKDLKILHLSEVASLVAFHGGSVDEVVAAWLHDILEDTEVTKQEVITMFGEKIGRIVEGLTDKSLGDITDILERKRKQALQIAEQGNSVKIVKIADQISNVLSVLSDPPVEWTYQQCIAYIEGARVVVEACREAHGELYGQFLIVSHEALGHYRNLE